MASVNFPNFPAVDFSKLDLNRLPKVDLPKVDLPKVDGEAVINAVRDAAYISVGVIVLAIQKAQVLRRDMSKSVNDQVGGGRAQLDEFVSTIDGRLVELETKFDAAFEDFRKRLPEQAGAVLGQAHDATKSARKQVRDTLTTTAA